MNNYKSFEAKLWNAISMLTSGVLTSLIYGLLSDVSYMLEIEGKQYKIFSVGTSLWGELGIILITFFVFWAVISVLIPMLLRIKKRFTYDKIKRVSAKELIRTLDVAKESIKNLYPIFYAEKNNDIPDTDLVALHVRELARIILLLHSNFLPHNQKLRKTIEKYFRRHEHSSVISIDRNVSSYEFKATIALLRKMVMSASEKGSSDKLLEQDCAEMKKNLDELGELSERIKKR